MEIGGLVTPIDPLAPIAACSVDANHLDVFAVGMDGGLYTTSFDSGLAAWSNLRLVGGAPPVPLGSVDGACPQGGTLMDIVATGRDGNVYAKRWDRALAVDPVAPSRVPNLDLR